MKRLLKRVLRRGGYELRHYHLSEASRLGRLLAVHGIDLVLDVGANTGQYAQLLREAGYGGRIVSFEPLSVAWQELSAARLSDPLWEVAPRVALGATDGEAVINVSSNSVSSSLLPMTADHRRADPTSHYVGTEKVRLARLDAAARDYVRSSRRVLLKIDAQGYESQVLEGASALMPMIHGWQLELSLVELYAGQPLFDTMIQRAKAAGFGLHALFPDFTDPDSGRMLQVNGIFFR